MVRSVYGSAVAAGVTLLLAAAQTSVSAQQPTVDTIDEKILQLLEHGRAVLPVGSPERGLPVLDPWHLESFSTRILESSAAVDVNLEATELKIWNVKTFVVNRVSTTLKPFRTIIEFSIPVLRVTADKYAMKGTVMHVFAVKGNGKLEINLIDVRVIATVNIDTAVPAIADLNVLLTVSKLQSKLTGTSPLVNSLLTEHGASLVNGKRSEISRAVRELLLPALNLYLARLQPEDLLQLLQ